MNKAVSKVLDAGSNVLILGASGVTFAATFVYIVGHNVFNNAEDSIIIGTASAAGVGGGTYYGLKEAKKAIIRSANEPKVKKEKANKK